MREHRFHWYYPALLGAIPLLVALVRPLWFDEALTVQNFALLESCGEIYRSWVIPNNQLLYTMMLHNWIGIAALLPLPPDVGMRLFSAMGGFAFLALFGWRFRRSIAMGPVALALAFSLPFALFGTALRGYIWSALWVFIALVGAENYARGGRLHDWALYAAGCILAVATIPTNLAALACVGLFFLRTRVPAKRLWIAGCTPFAMLFLFYGPIWGAFLRIVQWREGWASGGAAALAFYGAFVLAFPLLVAVLPFGWRRKWGRRWVPYGVLLLPGLAFLLLPKAPFPRVFFPLFPLFLILCMEGFDALLARFRPQKGAILAIVGGLAVAWSLFLWMEPVRSTVSTFCGGPMEDDYFYPYGARADFRPEAALQSLAETTFPAVYMSFPADPWSLMFYGRLRGMACEWLFDGPRGAVPSLPDGSAVFLKRGEDPKEIERRFGGTLTVLPSTDFHQCFLWRR